MKRLSHWTAGSWGRVPATTGAEKHRRRKPSRKTFWLRQPADPVGKRQKSSDLSWRKLVGMGWRPRLMAIVFLWGTHFFPTCQVRVVRFYQSCSSPLSSPPPSPPPPLPPLPCSRPPCQLFAKLFANFRTQWAQLDLNLGPSELSEHRWTSTWDRPSSVSTAGLQPGTVRAQWAPLDLNLGPSELSEHRWTSAWDPPSSVSTAGPQRPDRMSERMPEHMPDKVPECLPDRMPEDMPDRMPEGMPEDLSDRMPEGMPDKVPEHMPEDLPDRMPDRMSEDVPEDMPEDMPDRVLEDMPEHIAEDMPGRMPEDMPDRMPEDMPDKMPEDMSDRMQEDLPVTKRIDVMVGITRSKVFFYDQLCFCWWFWDKANYLVMVGPESSWSRFLGIHDMGGWVYSITIFCD